MKHLTKTLRHTVLILFSACMMLQAGGCTKAEQASHSASKPDMIEAIAQEREAPAQSAGESAETGLPDPVVTSPELTAPAITNDAHLPSLPESDVDVDLTKMSGTVVLIRFP